MLMVSTFSVQQITHALLLLMPLNLHLLLIPNASFAKHNNACDYLKKERMWKNILQDNILALLQDEGSYKVNDNMLHKEKFSSMLGSYDMNNVIIKSRVKQTIIYYCMITLHAHVVSSNNRRKGESSIITVPLEWYLESEWHSVAREWIHNSMQAQIKIIGKT